MSPTVLSTADAPAITTSATTAIQPRPWIADPTARPTAPPNTPTALTRLTRFRYEPPRSVSEPSSPPAAGSRPIVVLCTANASPSGTQMASAARIMSGHGSGAGFGRTSSASPSRMTAARPAAARVLIWARLHSSLMAAHLLAVAIFSERSVVPAPGPTVRAVPVADRRLLQPRPWHSSGMDDSRYLECLAADYGDLRDAAAAVELTVPVPTCPGWTMGDLVFHVAEVYLHKVAVMRTGEWPTQWPPPGAEHQAELPLLGRAYGELIAEFRARQPTDATPTWYDPDQTVAFWIRRMAQETAVHRIDAELAAGLPVPPVPDDLALDGVDEVLKRFLGYDAEDLDRLEGGHLAREGQDTIMVLAVQTAWTVRPVPPEVVGDDGASDRAGVVIRAAPDAMLRWLWGRAGDDVVQVTGDPDWAAYLRRMLVAATQ